MYLIFTGVSAWDNKVAYRAINARALKMANSSAYQIVRKDYGYYSDDEFDDFDNFDDTDEVVPNTNTVQHPTASTVQLATSSTQEVSSISSTQGTSSLAMPQVDSSSVQQPPPESILNIRQDVKNCIVETLGGSLVSELKRNVSRCFTCCICHEIRVTSLMYCPHTGRTLGCRSCMIRLNSCPICRQPTNFSSQRGFFIPGLQEYINTDPIPTPPHVSDIEENHDSEDGNNVSDNDTDN